MPMRDFVQNVQEYTARGQDVSYITLTDSSGSGVEQVIIQGQSGYDIKIVGFIISVTTAGVVEIKISGATVIHLEFNQRKAVPFYAPFPILVTGAGDVSVYWKPDSSPGSCYVTAIYHYDPA